MPSTVIAWRNWCFERGAVTPAFGSFETGAPLSNVLTPRTSELAISVSPPAPAGFTVDFIGNDKPFPGRPVRLVSVLNHNILSLAFSSDIFLQLGDEDGNFYTSPGLPATATLVQASDFQAHLHWLLPDSLPFIDIDRITQVSFGVGVGAVCGRRDTFTGEITEAPFQCGGIWAGPIWRPEFGARFDAFQQGIAENARGARSIGGQFYPNPEPRFRRGSLEFTLLPEPEVYSVNVSQPSLQQLAGWCARSRPLIVLPTDSNADLAYAQGLYGHLDNDPSWQLLDSASSEAADGKGRCYRAVLALSEAL
jgi:hypothetical protein